MSDELVLFQAEADGIESLDNGERGMRLRGLHDIEGTFEGTMLDGLLAVSAPGPIEVYFYGPDPHLPWWKHWFYRVRERITDTPYPTVVLAHGPATFEVEEEREDGDDIVISGKFTSAGKWQFKEVNR